VVISYRSESETAFRRLMAGTDLYFDELIYEWPIFDLQQGYYYIKLVLFSGSGQLADSVRAFVRATMRPGYPVHLPGNATISPGVADIDGDGLKEIVAGCQKGLFAYRPDGTVLDGFPYLATGICAPCRLLTTLTATACSTLSPSPGRYRLL